MQIDSFFLHHIFPQSFEIIECVFIDIFVLFFSFEIYIYFVNISFNSNYDVLIWTMQNVYKITNVNASNGGVNHLTLGVIHWKVIYI